MEFSRKPFRVQQWKRSCQTFKDNHSHVMMILLSFRLLVVLLDVRFISFTVSHSITCLSKIREIFNEKQESLSVFYTATSSGCSLANGSSFGTPYIVQGLNRHTPLCFRP